MQPVRTLSGTSGNASCGKCAWNSVLSSSSSGRECSRTKASRRMSFMRSTSPACVQKESCTPANAKPADEHGYLSQRQTAECTNLSDPGQQLQCPGAGMLLVLHKLLQLVVIIHAGRLSDCFDCRKVRQLISHPGTCQLATWLTVPA